MPIDISKLRSSTKSFLGAVLAFGGFFEIQPVHDYLIAAAHNHPHWTSVLIVVTGVSTLLHNPQVQDALGIKRTVKVEEVTLAPPEVKA